MKRWNGWGNVTTDYPLPPSAQAYLADFLGALDPQPDASYASVLQSVPASRLPSHPLVDFSPGVFRAFPTGWLPLWRRIRCGSCWHTPKRPGRG